MATIDKFVFVHILKCAGTTLKHTLFDGKFKKRYLYDSMFKPKRNTLVKNSEHPVIIEPQAYPDNYKDFDILFGHFKHDKYKHLNLPMFSFIRHPVDRMISQYFYHKGFYEKRGHKIDIIEFSKMWKNHMSYVLGDIDKYEYIGTVEDFNKSLNTMCDILKINTPKRIKNRRMYGTNNEKFSKKIRQKIEKINDDDMDLYYKVLTQV